MAWERRSIQHGMVVRDGQGRRVGTVQTCGPESFKIRKGLFSPRYRTVRYADVQSLRDGIVRLSSAAALTVEESRHNPPLWSVIHPLAETEAAAS